MRAVFDPSDFDLTPLAKQESLMDLRRSAFNQFCECLFVIHRDKLWTGKYDSFPDYCNQRWEFGKSRAYQMLSAAQLVIAEKSTPCNQVPLISNVLQPVLSEKEPIPASKPIQNEHQARQRIKAAKAQVIDAETGAPEVRHTCETCNGKGWHA